MSKSLKQSVLSAIFAGVAYAALACLLTPELFLGGFRLDERFLEYIPWRVEAGHQFANGQFPFFTDKVFAGMPLFSTVYVGVLYPPNWLYSFFPPSLSHYLSVFHLTAGAMGMYVYLRSRRMLPFVAFAGGLFFACCTFFLMHGAHVSLVEAGLMAPWLVWLARRVIRRPNPARAAGLAIGCALMIAIGYQQLFLFAVLWIAVEWISSVRFNVLGLRQTTWLAVGGLVGTALMSLQIFPVLKMVEHTPRAVMSADEWGLSPFSPSHVLIFFSPRAYGFDLNDFMGDGYLAEVLATIPSAGWALALFAFVSLFASRKFRLGGHGRRTVVYTIALLLAFLLALGSNMPGYDLLFHVPPFNLFRIPARYLYLVNVFAVVLGAGGLQHLLRFSPTRRWLAYTGCWVGWGVICFALFFAFRHVSVDTNVSEINPFEHAFVGSTVHVPQMTALLSNMKWPVFWGLLDKTGVHVVFNLLAGVFLLVPRRYAFLIATGWFLIFSINQRILEKHALWDAGDVEAIISLEENPLLSGFRSDDIQRLYALSHTGSPVDNVAFPFNSNAIPGLRSLSGYCPLINHQFTQAVGISSVGQVGRDGWMLDNPSVFHQLAVSHIIIDKRRFSPEEESAHARGLGHVFAPVSWTDHLELLEMINTRPRFDFAQRWYPAGETDDPWETVRYVSEHDPAKEPAQNAMLEDPPLDRLPERSEVVAPAEMTVLRDEPSFQKVRVKAPEGGILLVRDVYWPGWSYRVEGEKTWRGKVGRANGVVRYVPVPRGESVVTMRYRPPGWTLGLIVSSVSAVILCLLLVLSKRYDKWVKRKKFSLAELRRRATTLVPWGATRKG